MAKNKSAQAGSLKSVTLRRDGKGALKFNGERIGSATRNFTIEDVNDEVKTHQVSARLFKTAGGKYIVGIEAYNRTDEEYGVRYGRAADSLKSLAEGIREDSQPRPGGNPLSSWTDDDLLGELFEDTEIADQFIEHIE